MVLKRKSFTSFAFFFFALTLIIGWFLPEKAIATDLRGRVDGQHAYSRSGGFPLRDARIDLFEWRGNKWVSVQRTYTGGDGMFYLRNIRPGSYYLQINGWLNVSVNVQPVQMQDLPPILYRY